MLSLSQKEKRRLRKQIQQEAADQWYRLQEALSSLHAEDPRRRSLEAVQAFLARAFELF